MTVTSRDSVQAVPVPYRNMEAREGDSSGLTTTTVLGCIPGTLHQPRNSAQTLLCSDSAQCCISVLYFDDNSNVILKKYETWLSGLVAATSSSWKSHASESRFSGSWVSHRPAPPPPRRGASRHLHFVRPSHFPLPTTNAVGVLRNLRGRWLLIRFSSASYGQDPTSCCRQNLTGKNIYQERIAGPRSLAVKSQPCTDSFPGGTLHDTLQPSHQQREKGGVARGGHALICARGRRTHKSL